MNVIEAIKERRSVRKYKNEKVDRKLMEEIIAVSAWAPSWANLQVARYTLVDDKEIIAKFADSAMDGFAYNINTLRNANGVAVLSFVQGKSGKIDEKYISKKQNIWEMFDAGIACQTFCLAAHDKGVGTCIFGVFNEDSVAEIINLPEGETVAALIVYGYADGESTAPARKDVSELLRFV